MAFRASSQIKSDALIEIKEVAIRAKALAQQARSAASLGNYSAQSVLSLLGQIVNIISKWTALAAAPGLQDYAIDQENDLNYNVVTEYTTMLNAAVAVRDWIIANLPQATAPVGVVGRIAIYTIDASGNLIPDTYTSLQTAGLQTALDTFIATIT